MDSWTTRTLLAWMTERFRERGLDSPRVVAEMLLAHVLGCDRLRLYMEVDRPAGPAERQTLRGLVARALDHEPAQYLVGRAWFFGREFEVDRSVLIPRPSTEMLVEHAVRFLREAGAAQPDAADVGTGSGCIAISLAAALPGARVIATDLSAPALAVARRNAQRHGVLDRVEFRAGAGLEPLRAEVGRLDAIVSNPPYISDAEWADVAPNVSNHEPALALRGGPDGLDAIRPILAGAAALLRASGLLAVEIAHSQRDAVLAIARGLPDLAGADVHKDHEGFWRMLTATASARPPSCPGGGPSRPRR